jgi:uncharacterized protein YjiS (DUF1127 family)
MCNQLQIDNSTPHGNRQSDQEVISVQLTTLRRLLLAAGESLCRQQADQVREHCAQLVAYVLQSHPKLTELGQSRTPAGESAENIRTALLRVFEARAFYLAGMRHWRRVMRLRRALRQSSEDAFGYGDDLTGWS